MVKSEKMYTPQGYLELITDDCYIVRGDNDVEEIENILKNIGYEVQSYSLREIDRIVKNNLDVVLVDCLVYDEEENEFEHVYRWFETKGEM